MSDHTRDLTPLHADAAARILADAVAEAGALALSMFKSGIASWNKDNNSPVTEADIAVDHFLKERLTALAPDYGWLSEETADTRDRLGKRRVWVVDPIDGTRAFMAGGEDWAVCAALVEDERPIAAALFAPVTNEVFVAAVGRGATRNGALITAARRASLEGARIAGPAPAMEVYARAAAVTRLPRVRSLALRLTRVATGEIDLALASRDSFDWDLAAADLLVQEAAGTLSDETGALIRYNQPRPRHGALICAGPGLHGQALALARSAHDAISAKRSSPESP